MCTVFVGDLNPIFSELISRMEKTPIILCLVYLACTASGQGKLYLTCSNDIVIVRKCLLTSQSVCNYISVMSGALFFFLLVPDDVHIGIYN